MLSGNMLKILEILEDGEKTQEELRKSTRIPEKMLSGMIKRLEDLGFVERIGESLKITEKGFEELKRQKA